jgi:pilus assembly protein Flp/PilA
LFSKILQCSYSQILKDSLFKVRAVGGDLFMSVLRHFFRNENGATAIEYALIAGGIAVAIVAAVFGLGTAVKNNYTAVVTALK